MQIQSVAVTWWWYTAPYLKKEFDCWPVLTYYSNLGFKIFIFWLFSNREPQLVMQGLSQRASLYNGSIPMDVKFYCQWIFFSEPKKKKKNFTIFPLSLLVPSLLPSFFLSLSFPSWLWQYHTSMLTAWKMTISEIKYSKLRIYDVWIIYWPILIILKLPTGWTPELFYLPIHFEMVIEIQRSAIRLCLSVFSSVVFSKSSVNPQSHIVYFLMSVLLVRCPYSSSLLWSFVLQ